MGIVYFVRNPAFPHLVKIGVTSKNTVEDRGLNGSNVPEDFETLYAFEHERYEELEKSFHKKLDFARHQTLTGRSTEFFFYDAVSKEIEHLKIQYADITEEFNEQLVEESIKTDEKDSHNSFPVNDDIPHGWMTAKDWLIQNNIIKKDDKKWWTNEVWSWVVQVSQITSRKHGCKIKKNNSNYYDPEIMKDQAIKYGFIQ